MQALKRSRESHGALELDTLEARPIFSDNTLADLAPDPSNRAKELIEEGKMKASDFPDLAAEDFIKEPQTSLVDGAVFDALDTVKIVTGHRGESLRQYIHVDLQAIRAAMAMIPRLSSSRA